MNVIDDLDVSLSESLVAVITPFLSTFEARVAPIVDNHGARFEAGPLIVHSSAACGLPEVPINAVAAVIECHENLTIDLLRESYARIEAIKLADKITTGPRPEAAVDMTAGFIVARTCDHSIEDIAAEAARLNAVTTSQQWPDVIAVLSAGLINYTAEVPGSDHSGDFFLQAKDLLDSNIPTPSIYVHLMIRGSGTLTLKKVTSLLTARVAIFEPGIDVPDYRLLLEGVPRHGLPAETYQPNLTNRLVALSAQQGASIKLNLEEFKIESAGKGLGSIQFLDWQDGGVLIVRGEFPMLPFFIHLKQVAPGIPFEHMQYFGRPGNLCVSYVLPISRVHFLKVLNLFERQSINIRVKPHSPKLLIQKVADEGVSTPFVSRLMVGVMDMRDAVHASEADRRRFDELYEPVLSGLRDAREAYREIENLWSNHREAIDAGTIVRVERNNTHIGESIDRGLKRELDAFLTTTVRTAKNSLQVLTQNYGVDIGFLFKKEGAFRAGVALLSASDAALASYLENVRAWTEPLVNARNDLEHGTVQPPKVEYLFQHVPLIANEPTFVGQPITKFTDDTLQHLLCFAEEITIHCLSLRLPTGLQITEIAGMERAPDFPTRFRLSVSSGERTAWRISGGGSRFDLT